MKKGTMPTPLRGSWIMVPLLDPSMHPAARGLRPHLPGEK